MNIKKGLSIFISAVMVFSPIMSVHAYDTDSEKKVIESPAVSDNDISEDKAVITHEVPKVKASSGTCGDDLTWTLDDNGALTISGTGDMTDYTYSSNVPWSGNRSSIKTVVIEDGVTGICNYAFENCTSLVLVTIPDSVTSIDSFAFSKCSSLTSVTIPGSIASIGYNAFSYCSSLTSVTIADGVISIGDDAFDSCSSLTSIVIPDSVINMGRNVFAWCSKLESVTIGGSVTSIGDYLFYACSSLTSIVIPDSVVSIGDNSFGNCSSLASVTIGTGVASIGEYAFSDCPILAGIYITDVANWCNIDFSSYPLRDGVALYVNGEKATNLVIPEGVTSISSYAFWGCTSISSVTIPGSVTNIGESAFDYCTGITKVYVTDLAKWCGISFSNHLANPLCNGAKLYVNGEHVTDLVIPDGVTSVGYHAFEGCSDFTSITIPSSLTQMNSSFSDCENLENVYITDLAKWCMIDFSSNPLSQGAKLCLNGEPLTNITIPDGVTKIGDHAFAGYSILASVTIPESVTSIGEGAFYRCSKLTSMTIPNSVTKIGDGAFSGCSGLKTVTISNNVEKIGSYVFGGCVNLTSVVIPYGVEYIDWHTFHGCTGLKSVVISGSVYSMSNGVFEGCTSLELVTLEDGIKYISDYSFSGCVSLKSIVIPNSVKSIGEGVFYGCSSLASVTMSENVEYIGWRAFFMCTSLESIVIPKSVKHISAETFFDCSGLMSVTIEDGVEGIDRDAFSGCSSLTTVTIPASIKKIGYYAFYRCSSLESIYITSIESWNNIPFEEFEMSPFYYAEKLYLNGELVTNFVLPQGITNINSYAFCGIECIKSLKMPDDIVSLQKGAFEECSGIETVIIPKSLEEIKENAFLNCSSIKKVYYAGSEAEWNEIVIEEGNDCLKNAEIVFGVITDDEGESDDNSHGAHLAMGTLGTSQWVLFEDGAVIVNGTGALEFADIPFYKYRDMITSVKISDGITSIPEDMFYKCEKITKVIIPESVTSIGDSAFWRCSGITAVYYGGTAEEWNNITIGEYNDALFGAEFKYNYSAVTEVGIKFLANPPKDAYVYGEELALDDTIVVKKYSDGSFTEIEDYTVTGYDKYTFGTQDVSITHDGHTIDLVVSVKPTEANSLTVPVTAGMTVEEFSAQYSDHYNVLVFDNDKETLLLEDDVMKSGCVVQFVRDGSVVDSVAVNVGGDATGDGVVNGKDLIRIKKQILEGNAVEYTEFADVNRDGVVDEADLDALVNMVL